MRIILECDIAYKYTYDNYGNILSKSTYKLNTTTLINTDTYTYDNANYKDQLTKFNNDTITYDGIGNPLKIGNTTYNWSNGRELQSISNTNLNVSYKYDRNGIRTKKILNNEEISYCLENSSIVIEKHKNYMLYFLRDDSNSLLGFTYQGNTYYYKKNAFDDIIGIYDSNYKEVCTYSYDAYGNILSIKYSTGKDITDTSNVALINPFRYGSYYYDTETGLYYLNSRYYSPKMGRFINCDGLIGSSKTVIGYNLYTYCNNNFICYRDAFGSKGILGYIYDMVTSKVRETIFNVSHLVGYAWEKPISGNMLSAALEKSNIDAYKYKDTKRQLIEKLAQSIEVKEIIKKNVSITSGNTFKERGETEFISDSDLYYSVQHARYTVSGLKQNNYWIVQVRISDVYDFTEWRKNIDRLGDIANDFGYILQFTKLIEPYAWDADFMIFYSESVDN